MKLLEDIDRLIAQCDTLSVQTATSDENQSSVLEKLTGDIQDVDVDWTQTGEEKE
jgi:hypothetical protein